MLGGFKSEENDYSNGKVLPRRFIEFFRIRIRVQPKTFFSLTNFSLLYRYAHGPKNEKCIPLLSYISKALNIGACWMSLWMWVNEGIPPIVFCFILHECEIYMQQESTDNTEDIMFFEKIFVFVQRKSHALFKRSAIAR